jgi:membrane protein
VAEPDSAPAAVTDPEQVGSPGGSGSPGVDEPSSDAERSIKERVAEVQGRVTAKVEEYRTRRKESAPIDVAFRVIEADRQYAGGLIAGGMAFRIFVVLVPFAFFVVTAFGFVAEAVSSDSPQSLARDLGITGLMASAINASVGSSTWQRVVTMLAAAYALLWATWTLVRAMRTVYGLAWAQPPSQHLARPWRPTLWVVAAMLVMFLVEATVGVVLDESGLLAAIAVELLAVALIIAVWIVVSLLLPREPDAGWQAMVPGAVLVGVGAAVLQFLTIYFFSRYVESKTETYGSIGASLAILLWAYLLGRLVVTSAFLNAARWRRARLDSDAPAAASPE